MKQYERKRDVTMQVGSAAPTIPKFPTFSDTIIERWNGGYYTQYPSEHIYPLTSEALIAAAACAARLQLDPLAVAHFYSVTGALPASREAMEGAMARKLARRVLVARSNPSPRD